MVRPCLNSSSEKRTQNLLECFVNLFSMASLTLVLARALAATAQAQEVPVKGVCFRGHVYNFQEPLGDTFWSAVFWFCLFFNLSFRNSCLSWRQRQENPPQVCGQLAIHGEFQESQSCIVKCCLKRPSTSNCLIDIINIKVICPLKKSFWATEMAL